MDQEINAVYSQLAIVVNNTYAKLANKVLYRTEYGIVVYNKYVIRKTKSGIELVSRYESIVRKFNSAKNALVWAILDHHGKYSESRRVLELDVMIAGAEMDSRIQEKMARGGSAERYLIHASKLQRNREKQKQFIYELDKYTIQAQKCQQQGIHNETK